MAHRRTNMVHNRRNTSNNVLETRTTSIIVFLGDKHYGEKESISRGPALQFLRKQM